MSMQLILLNLKLKVRRLTYVRHKYLHIFHRGSNSLVNLRILISLIDEACLKLTPFEILEDIALY